jgi:hypothetical protein
MSRKQWLSRRGFLQQSAAWAALDLVRQSGFGEGMGVLSAESVLPIPDKTVVLTFDDAVKSHRTFVAPLLKGLGLRATFFVTHRWMNDQEHFMSWQEIAEIHQGRCLPGLDVGTFPASGEQGDPEKGRGQNVGRTCGNPRVPCLPADPKLPDCVFGKTVRTQGRLWFFEGTDIEQEIARRLKEFSPPS